MFILIGLALVFCTNFASTLGRDCGEDQLFIIKNIYSGLVVSGTSNITLEHYSSAAEQKWRFERAYSAGLFYIINNQTGLAMGIHHCGAEYCSVVTTPNNTRLPPQEWMVNSDNRISRTFNLHVFQNDFTPGKQLTASIYKEDDASQGFSIHPIN